MLSLEGLKRLTGLVVPTYYRVLVAPRRQPPAVRAEGDVHARPGDPRVESKVGFLLLLQARRVPEFDLPVAARRNKVFAVAAEDQRPDFPVVGSERVELLTGSGIQNLHLLA